MSQPPASPPPGPPPYYPPPPPGPPPGAPGEPPKTIAILALVFGGAALLFGLIPVAGIFLGSLFGIAAIVLGIVGIFKSHRLMSIIGIGLAVLGLIVTVIVTIAVGRAAEDIIEDWPTDYETGTEDEDDPGHGDAPQDQAEGTDPTAPLPAGSEITTGNWTVIISDVVPDATETILADEFNTPPEQGHQYFMFRVNATYQGAASSSPWLNLYPGVYIDGVLYEDDLASCGFQIFPEPYTEAPEVYAGGTSSGNYCVMVPSEGAGGAVIAVQDELSPRYFVAIE